MATADVSPPLVSLRPRIMAASAILAHVLAADAHRGAVSAQPSQGASVPMTLDEAANLARAQLTDDERRSAIAYLDKRELAAGSVLTIDERDAPVPNRSVVAFVDKVPQANWGHPCRYLLIDLDSGAISSIDAQFPPFLRSTPPTLRMIWKGDAAPDWAAAAPPDR
jgi:hypothetical protein